MISVKKAPEKCGSKFAVGDTFQAQNTETTEVEERGQGISRVNV